jgi:glycosyltransferase involved in cell wall biosynthesis
VKGPVSVHVLVPEAYDDPRRPSGGNRYDQRVVEELRAAGRQVHVHHDADDVPSGAVLLVDGLIADRAVAHADRLRVVPLLHVPYDGPLLDEARAVVVTSDWTARQLDRPVHVARPGVDPAQLVIGSPTGGALLCVGAVVPAKGHDVLLDALAELDDLAWQLTCVGSVDLDPAWGAGLRPDERVTFTGPLVGADLDSAYASADLLVLPTRREAYGMVVTEALARGVPVLASDVGGVPEALGPGGGVLVPPDDPGALADALRRWLEDPALRTSLCAAARRRRITLTGWDRTAEVVAGVLDEVAA